MPDEGEQETGQLGRRADLGGHRAGHCGGIRAAGRRYLKIFWIPVRFKRSLFGLFRSVFSDFIALRPVGGRAAQSLVGPGAAQAPTPVPVLAEHSSGCGHFGIDRGRR